MPSSYTSSLRLVLPVTGELTGTWGDTVNNGLTELVEDAIAGTAAITMTDANLTLSTANEAADQARCMFIALSGGSLTATRDVICPSVSKLYVVLNATTGSQSIRFKTAAGTGVTVPNGSRALLYCDGTNVTNAIGLPPLSGTGSNGSALSSLGALGADTQAKSSAYTVVEGDRGDVIFCTNSFTLSLTAAATLGDGFIFGVVNAGSGTITIDPDGAETIDGAATLAIAPNQTTWVVTDGTVWRTVGLTSNPASDTLVPTGLVGAFARNSAPTGWLKANGAAVSRTTYEALFAAIGTTFGAGDGSTTFNLPDLRGEFVRGWDDGRGLDSGRAFASVQGSQNLAHRHGADYVDPTEGGSYVNRMARGVSTGGSPGSTSNGADVGILPDGGSEARPRNIALLFCIKY